MQRWLNANIPHILCNENVEIIYKWQYNTMSCNTIRENKFILEYKWVKQDKQYKTDNNS
jgi:hypothetical protein